jgi:hypothetical protein
MDNHSTVVDQFVKKGFITEEQLSELREEAKKEENRWKRIGDIAIEKGWLTESQLGEVLAERMNCDFVDLDQFEFNGELIDLFEEETLRKYKFIPLVRVGKKIRFATNDPLDFFASDEIRNTTGCVPFACYSTKSAIARALDRHYIPKRMAPVVDEMKEKLGAEESPAFIEKLGKMFGLELWNQREFIFTDEWLDEVCELFQSGLFEKYCCIPLEEKDGVKYFVVPNPADMEAYEALKKYCGKPVRFKLASRGTILRVFRDG